MGGVTNQSDKPLDDKSKSAAKAAVGGSLLSGVGVGTNATANFSTLKVNGATVSADKVDLNKLDYNTIVENPILLERAMHLKGVPDREALGAPVSQYERHRQSGEGFGGLNENGYVEITTPDRFNRTQIVEIKDNVNEADASKRVFGSSVSQKVEVRDLPDNPIYSKIADYHLKLSAEDIKQTNIFVKVDQNVAGKDVVITSGKVEKDDIPDGYSLTKTDTRFHMNLMYPLDKTPVEIKERIEFPSGKTDFESLDAANKAKYDKMYQGIKANLEQGVPVSIDGNASFPGGEALNLKLSQQRADAVVNKVRADLARDGVPQEMVDTYFQNASIQANGNKKLDVDTKKNVQENRNTHVNTGYTSAHQIFHNVIIDAEFAKNSGDLSDERGLRGARLMTYDERLNGKAQEFGNQVTLTDISNYNQDFVAKKAGDLFGGKEGSPLRLNVQSKNDQSIDYIIDGTSQSLSGKTFNVYVPVTISAAKNKQEPDGSRDILDDKGNALLMKDGSPAVLKVGTKSIKLADDSTVRWGQNGPEIIKNTSTAYVTENVKQPDGTVVEKKLAIIQNIDENGKPKPFNRQPNFEISDNIKDPKTNMYGLHPVRSGVPVDAYVYGKPVDEKAKSIIGGATDVNNHGAPSGGAKVQQTGKTQGM